MTNETMAAPEKVFNFTFTESQTNLILRTLAELPYKQTYEIINLIQRQGAEQLAREHAEENDEE
jgi:hypothetical protein